ncbi:MAG: hypothetical protein LBV41_06130 [Cytophagaceae bacterium]|nr:hypothetical protein [Cytophagaceae bacterium]
MKIYHLIAVVFFCLPFTSCLKEDNNYDFIYCAVGTLLRTTDGAVYFRTDTTTANPEELTLYISNKDALEKVESGYRFFMNFNIIGEIDKTTRSGDVTFLGGLGMYNRDVDIVELDNKPDSTGTDPITIDDGWISHDYLSLGFSFRAAGQANHYFYLTMDKNYQKEDTVVLKFNHDANSDMAYMEYKEYYITSPISAFKNQAKDYIYIEVIPNVESDNIKKSHTFLYKYKSSIETGEDEGMSD